MSNKIYTLKLECEDPVAFGQIAKKKSIKFDNGYWEYELVEKKNSNCLQKLIDFYRHVRNHYQNKIIEATIWILYEYDQQCNLEFSADQMKQLSELEINVCISCWERGN